MVGFEPTTSELTAHDSTIELHFSRSGMMGLQPTFPKIQGVRNYITYHTKLVAGERIELS